MLSQNKLTAYIQPDQSSEATNGTQDIQIGREVAKKETLRTQLPAPRKNKEEQQKIVNVKRLQE